MAWCIDDRDSSLNDAIAQHPGISLMFFSQYHSFFTSEDINRGDCSFDNHRRQRCGENKARAITSDSVDQLG